MKSELDISLNQYKLLADKMTKLIRECKKVIDSTKKIYNNGNINYNPTDTLEKLVKEYDNSY